MNTLEVLNSIDEQELEFDFLESKQRMKKLISSSGSVGKDAEAYALRALADLNLFLLALRHEKRRKYPNHKQPISLRIQCPACEEGTLLLESRVGGAAVFCSHCLDYEVEQ